MSKTLSKFSQYGEIKGIHNKIGVLGKGYRIQSKNREIDTTGLSNIGIDEAVEGPCGNLPTEELNGILISDPINEKILIRQKGRWNSFIKHEEVEPPIPLPLKSPWENYGAGNYEAHYYKDLFNRVYIGGLVKLPEADHYVYGGENSLISVLPEEYWPSGKIYYPQFVQTPSVAQMIVIFIGVTGEIKITQAAAQGENSGKVAYLSLAGINFRAGYG